MGNSLRQFRSCQLNPESNDVALERETDAEALETVFEGVLWGLYVGDDSADADGLDETDGFDGAVSVDDVACTARRWA